MKKDAIAFLKVKLGKGFGLVSKDRLEEVVLVYKRGSGDRFEALFASKVGSGSSRIAAMQEALEICQRSLTDS